MRNKHAKHKGYGNVVAVGARTAATEHSERRRNVPQNTDVSQLQPLAIKASLSKIIHFIHSLIIYFLTILPAIHLSSLFYWNTFIIVHRKHVRTQGVKIERVKLRQNVDL